jgi:hypothetical protein
LSELASSDEVVDPGGEGVVSSLHESAESLLSLEVAVAASGAQLKIISSAGTLAVVGAQLRSIRVVALAIIVPIDPFDGQLVRSSCLLVRG